MISFKQIKIFFYICYNKNAYEFQVINNLQQKNPNANGTTSKCSKKFPL